MTLQEIRDVVHTHNTLFSVDITKSGAKMNNPYRMFKDYWNKPTNIRVDDLLFVRVNDMSVTVKLDGVRQFLFITRNSTYALGPPTDLYCIDEGISKLDGTLLDTEKYTSPDGIVTYYAFDILFNRGASVRSAYFKERIAILDNIIDVINLEKKDKSYKVIRKHFYTNGTIYEKTIEALAWIEEHPEFSSDGLIFQPTHHYKNNHTKKWKPASQRRQSTVAKTKAVVIRIGRDNPMSKHKGKPQSQAVQPANQTSPAATPAEPTPKTAMFVVNSISELIAQVEKAGGTLSPEAKAELEKMRSAQETLEAPKRLADAEADVTASLPKLLETIAGKHKVSFSGRKVVVVFRSAPKEGEPNPIVSFGPEVEVIASGKKRSGNGNGFKSHGAVVLHENGKDTMADSLHALVIGKGLKYEGRAKKTKTIPGTSLASPAVTAGQT